MRAGGRFALLAFLVVMTLPSLVVAVILPETWWIAALVVLTVVLIWLILPLRYELYRNRLRLVFPVFRWDIGFDSVEAIQEGSLANAFAYWGVRFATSPGEAVVIKRRQPNLLTRPQVVISPVEREQFLPRAQAALAAYRRLAG